MDKEALVKAVMESNISPDKIEALNNTIRLQMASSLVSSVATLDETDRQISELSTKLSMDVQTKLKAKLETDSLTLEEAIDYLEKINSMQVRIAETKRKIFNGKEMFAASPLSKREMALMELLKKVDTEEKRKALEDLLDKMQDDFNE